MNAGGRHQLPDGQPSVRPASGGRAAMPAPGGRVATRRRSSSLNGAAQGLRPAQAHSLPDGIVDLREHPEARAATGVTSTGPAFLRVRDLVKTYGGKTAVAGVSFAIRSGECFGLLGPNGAGKTTTILAACGLIRPDSGRVQVGSDKRDPSAARARRDIGYVPQEIAVYEDLSGRENLSFFGRLYGLGGRQLKERIGETLAFVDLTSRADQKVGAYSGGMKRRLNIAAALLHQPGLLILDEPTVGIDPQSRNSILENLAELRRAGAALLYTSHYMEEIERICDRIAIMDAGEILAEGTPGSLLTLLGDEADEVRLATMSTPPDSLVRAVAACDGVISAAAASDGLKLTARDVTTALPGVLAEVARHGTKVTGLSVAQADLESVFLHLTGKGLRDG